MKKVDDSMSSKKGFTLIELLAVIAILALLMLLVAPNILRMFNEGKKETFAVQYQKVYKAIEEQAVYEEMYGSGSKEYYCNYNEEECVGYEVDSIKDSEVKYYATVENGKITKLSVSNDEYYIISDKYDVSQNDVSRIADNESIDFNDLDDVKSEVESLTTQTFKPQYYAFFEGNIGMDAPLNSSTVPPSGKKVYIGYDIVNNKISAAYACFIRNEKEYCLKGGDGGYAYEYNQTVLDEAYKNTYACSFDEESSSCSEDESLSFDINVDIYGSLGLYYGPDTYCEFDDGGYFGCGE